MAENAKKDFTDKDFMLLNIIDYLNDNLKSGDLKRFNELIKENKDLSKQFIQSIGRFQFDLKQETLNENDLITLKASVENLEERKTREIKKIESLNRNEIISSFRRRLIIFSMVAIVIFGIVYYFTPKPREKFNPLSSLGYEALAMDEDPQGRLDFPSSNLADINGYVHADKSLTFNPIIFRILPKGWKPEGASIIDYEIAKIIAVQFYNINLDERMFYFNFKGNLTDLPPAKPGNISGFIYQTYASDKINVIVWQQDKNTLGMLIGYRSAPELANIAKTGLKL